MPPRGPCVPPESAQIFRCRLQPNEELLEERLLIGGFRRIRRLKNPQEVCDLRHLGRSHKGADPEEGHSGEGSQPYPSPSFPRHREEQGKADDKEEEGGVISRRQAHHGADHCADHEGNTMTPLLLRGHECCRGVCHQPGDGPRAGIVGGDEVDPHGDPRGDNRANEWPPQLPRRAEADGSQKRHGDEHIDASHHQDRGLHVLADEEVMEVVVANWVGAIVEALGPHHMRIVVPERTSRRLIRLQDVASH